MENPAGTTEETSRSTDLAGATDEHRGVQRNVRSVPKLELTRECREISGGRRKESHRLEPTSPPINWASR